MKKLRLLSILLAITLCLSACGASGTGESAKAEETPETPETTQETTQETEQESSSDEYKDELHIAFNAQPSTLDAPITSAGAARTISRGIYESLMALNTDYKAVPELAESMEVNEDSTEFTFKLRQGVKFHNGEEMKANDVVASMNRWIENYGNAKAIVGDSIFEEVDEYTVKISLGSPAISFPEVIAGAKQIAAIMPASVIATATESGLTEFISTGPYKFAEWKQDQYILLEKYEDYISYGDTSSGFSGKKEALTDKVYFDIVTDAATRLSGLQTGEYDVATALSIDNYEMIEADPSTLAQKELSAAITVVFNKAEGLSSNEKFRQAINAGLDLDAVLKGALSSEDFYRLDSGYLFQEQSSWYSDAGKELYNQKDIEKAKELLQEAGYNGEEFRLMVSQEYPEFYNTGLVMENQLSEMGINVKLDVVDWPSQQELMTDPTQYDAFVTSFSMVSVPTELLYLSEDWAGWTTDEKIGELVSAINTAPTQSEAYGYWDELQGYVWESLPVLKVGDQYSFSAQSEKLEDMEYFMGPLVWNVKVAK